MARQKLKDKISLLLAQGKTRQEIARALNKHVASVNTMIRRYKLDYKLEDRFMVIEETIQNGATFQRLRPGYAKGAGPGCNYSCRGR